MYHHAACCRPLHKEVMQDRVSFICDKEGVQLDAEGFELLAQVWTGQKLCTVLGALVGALGCCLQVLRSHQRCARTY